MLSQKWSMLNNGSLLSLDGGFEPHIKGSQWTATIGASLYINITKYLKNILMNKLIIIIS